MKFIAGFIAGVAITLLGSTQAEQAERHRQEIWCDQHLFDEQCLHPVTPTLIP